MKGLYLSNRFYWVLSGIIALFFMGYGIRVCFELAQIFLALLGVLFIIDFVLLYLSLIHI